MWLRPYTKVTGGTSSTWAATLQAWLLAWAGRFRSCLSVQIDVEHELPCKELLLVILTDGRQVTVAVAAATH